MGHGEVRDKALKDLQDAEILTLEGHFDYGNGYHGRIYLNAHQFFRRPSTIWRFAQDLIDVLPGDIMRRTDVVAGPVTGGALLAHTVAGLLDSRRALTHPPASFAPLNLDAAGALSLRPFYGLEVAGKGVLIVDDVRNTGGTLARCAALIEAAGGVVVATAEIYDRLEAIEKLAVPNFALVEYKAPPNYEAAACPLCRVGMPITKF